MKEDLNPTETPVIDTTKRKTEILAHHGGKVAIVYFVVEKLFQIAQLFFHR